MYVFWRKKPGLLHRFSLKAVPFEFKINRIYLYNLYIIMLEECKIYKTNIFISFLKVCNMDKGSIRIFLLFFVCQSCCNISLMWNIHLKGKNVFPIESKNLNSSASMLRLKAFWKTSSAIVVMYVIFTGDCYMLLVFIINC